jgi:hypothetical protein
MCPNPLSELGRKTGEEIQCFVLSVSAVPCCALACTRARDAAVRDYRRSIVMKIFPRLARQVGTHGTHGTASITADMAMCPNSIFIERELGHLGQHRNRRMSDGMAMRPSERFANLGKRSRCARDDHFGNLPKRSSGRLCGQIRTMVRIWRSGAVTANCLHGSAAACPNVLPIWENVRNADAGWSADRHHGHRCFRKGTVRHRRYTAPANASTMQACNSFARYPTASGQCPGLLGCCRAAVASRPRAALCNGHAREVGRQRRATFPKGSRVLPPTPGQRDSAAARKNTS